MLCARRFGAVYNINRMRIAFLFLISFSVNGQINIEIDTVIKTSEFYAWTYDIDRSEHGTGGTYWKLDYDYNLYYGITAHHPPSNNMVYVGTWKQVDDTLVLHVKKSKHFSKKESFEVKYGIHHFKWTTNNGKSKQGELSILTSYCILLTSNPKLDFNDIKSRLVEYLNKDTIVSTEKSNNIFEHFDSESPIREFFNTQKIVIGIKQYRNNNLWVQPR